MHPKKPIKKTDTELWRLIQTKISNGDYIFLSHAKKRLKDRSVTDIEVLDILENRNKRSKRNKVKDKYEHQHDDWSYCIEGSNIDGEKIRVALSFDENFMLIITVIRIAKARTSHE